MTEFRTNRPERCGGLRADVSHILISARSAAEHFSAPEFHDLLVSAMREIIQHATDSLARDDALADQDQAAFDAHMLSQYGEQAHECGTPASGEQDTSDYPVPMTVGQRDPADPESWIFRCGAEHALTSGERFGGGWQSPDYASEDDALTAAAEHARAMHDGGLPNELAERVTAAERRAAEQADSLIGRNVRRTDDDGPVPMVGTVHAITADPEFVMVAWQDGSGTPIVTVREAMDELTAAGGHWAIPKPAAPDADHSSDGGYRYPVRHR